jgi:hypothetical protein
MRITVAFVVAIAGGSLAAQEAAQQHKFQFEVLGGWVNSTTDTSPDVEINQYVVAGTYHLQPVMLADHPWSEAPFLEHSTWVSLGVSYTTFDVGSFSADGPLFGAGFRFADKQTPVAAEVNFSIGTLDGDAGIDIDRTIVNGSVGYWLKPNAIIGVDIGMEETEANSMLDVEELRYGIFGKVVHDLGSGRAINGEARLGVATIDDSTTKDDNFEVGIAGDFYFTPQYSAGALVEISTGDAVSAEGTTVGVRGTAWFTPQAALNVSFTTFMADDSTFDEDTLAVFFDLRF